MKELLSSSEIVALNLPGMPSTKVAIAAMAKREGWYSEQRKGVGGTRMVYELPSRLAGLRDADTLRPPASGASGASGEIGRSATSAAPPQGKVVGTIAAGSGKVDLALLETAIQALAQWEEERHVTVAKDRRPAVIAVLYDFLQHGPGAGDDALAVVLRALG